MYLTRGLLFRYEAVREWEAKLTPVLSDEIRRRRRRPATALSGAMSLASEPLPAEPAALRWFAASLQAELARKAIEIAANAAEIELAEGMRFELAIEVDPL